MAATSPATKCFFGFDDSISQPRFAQICDLDTEEANEPIDPLGTALLGYPTLLERLVFRASKPAALGFNGTFNAFRILSRTLLGSRRISTRRRRSRPVAGARQRGKDRQGGGPSGSFARNRRGADVQNWRNGIPYGASPHGRWPDNEVSNFDYDRTSRCPAGSDVRRVNSRGGTIVQRIANHAAARAVRYFLRARL
jgi:hypothetical protein